MLQFAWPLAAIALILPWLVARFAPPAAPVATPLRVPFLRDAKTWSDGSSRGARPRLRLWLALAAWAALVSAASRPQWIGDPVGVPVTGRSMLLALDVSASMRKETFGAQSRLEIMRRTAKAFIESRSGDRIGLVVFGSRPYVQVPLTFDLTAVASMVDDAFVGLAGEGTALGDAIGLAVARLRAMQHEARVLVVLTDGDSTDGVMTVPDAAQLARHHGVRVYPIGIGEANSDGFNEPALKHLAAETGGRYFHAGAVRALAGIYQELDRHEPTVRNEHHLRPSAEVYVWPLGLALLLALAAWLAGTHPRGAEWGTFVARRAARR